MADPDSWPDGTVTLTSENFDDVTGSYSTVLVYMWAKACAPCKELKPELDELAAEWRDDIVLGTLKTDDYPALSKQNRSLKGRFLGKLSRDFDGPSPTFVLYEDKELVSRTWGIDAEYAKAGRELDYIREWVAEERHTDTSTDDRPVADV